MKIAKIEKIFILVDLLHTYASNFIFPCLWITLHKLGILMPSTFTPKTLVQKNVIALLHQQHLHYYIFHTMKKI